MCNLDLSQSIQPFYVALFIKNYNRNGSNVYSCLLDVSKAFDKIHYGKLFNVLLRKDVPFCIIRILLDAYTRQQARVLWNICTSDYFTISNGVNQGGVLSPILFSSYIDRLLILLKKSWNWMPFKWNLLWCLGLCR